MLRYYLIFLFGSLFTLSAVNVAIGTPFWHTILCVFGGAVLIFLLDAWIAWILHALPEKWFSHKFKIFHVSKFERKFLEKIGTKKWKDKVPEMGQVCDFKKNKLGAIEENYITKFLTETCYAEVIHIFMALIGVGVLLVIPLSEFFNISLWLILINFVLNVPPILIQRYNRPKLEIALKRAQRQNTKTA